MQKGGRVYKKAPKNGFSCKQITKKTVMNTDTERKIRFEKMARQYSTDLYRYAMWICGNDALSKDLVQETFLRAW